MRTTQKIPLPLLLLFTARWIATEVIWLLPAYSLSRECVYRVVAQQRVYISQYHTPTLPNKEWMSSNSMEHRSWEVNSCSSSRTPQEPERRKKIKKTRNIKGGWSLLAWCLYEVSWKSIEGWTRTNTIITQAKFLCVVAYFPTLSVSRLYSV
jgi:hypothetical protein